MDYRSEKINWIELKLTLFFLQWEQVSTAAESIHLTFCYHNLADFLTFDIKQVHSCIVIAVLLRYFNTPDFLLCEEKVNFTGADIHFSTSICCVYVCNLGNADKFLNVTDSAGLPSED